MKGSDELKANTEKALQMKQEAEPQAHIPEHQTSHEDEAQGSQFQRTMTEIMAAKAAISHN